MKTKKIEKKSHEIKLWIEKHLTRLFLVILTLGYSVVIPLGLLLLSPIYLYRLIVQMIGKLYFPWSSKWDNMISSRNAVFAFDQIYEKPTANIVVCIHVDGILPIKKLQADVLAKIIWKREKDNGSLKYPQLRQYPEKFLNFYCWTWESDFQISEHVKIGQMSSCKKTIGTRTTTTTPTTKHCSENDEILKFHEEMIRSPFPRNRSPWEFCLLYLTKEDSCVGKGNGKTLMFFKIHHCLSDGFAVLQLLMSDLVGHEMSMPIPHQTHHSEERNKIPGAINFARNLFKIPYEQVKQIYYSKDMNLWHNPNLKLTRKYHAVLSKSIEVQFIKDIKNTLKDSSFTSIILTGISSGIAKHFQDEDYSKTRSVKIPDYLHTICPIPIPQRNSTESLGNLWTFCFVKLPIKISSFNENVEKHEKNENEIAHGLRIERLAQLSKSIKDISKSTVPKVNFALIPFVGSLNPKLATVFSRNIFSTFITSIFPGPHKECIFHGHRVTDMYFSGGLLHGNQGFCTTLISYNGKFRIFLLVDKGIIQSKNIAQNLMDNIVMEIESLGVKTT